jgi:hypothetical protein
MYKIVSGRDQLRIVDIYCKKCMFELLLKLNDIFEIHQLLDGTDSYIVNKVYKGMDIPQEVYNELVNGQYIGAIKKLRQLSGTFEDRHGDTYPNMGLKEAKDIVDKWRPLVTVLRTK